jgi:hypothetical protein
MGLGLVLLAATGCSGGGAKSAPTTYTVPMATRVSDWDTANGALLTRLTGSDTLPPPPAAKTCQALPPVVTTALTAHIPDPPLEAKWKAALAELQHALTSCADTQTSGGPTVTLSTASTAAIAAEYQAGWQAVAGVIRDIAAVSLPDFTNGPPPTSPTTQ